MDDYALPNVLPPNEGFRSESNLFPIAPSIPNSGWHNYPSPPLESPEDPPMFNPYLHAMSNEGGRDSMLPYAPSTFPQQSISHFNPYRQAPSIFDLALTSQGVPIRQPCQTDYSAAYTLGDKYRTLAIGVPEIPAYDTGESSASYITAADTQTAIKAHKVDAYVSGPFAHCNTIRKGKEEVKEGSKSRNRTQAPAQKAAKKDQPDVFNTLIYRALMQAPDHRMVLQDIYHFIQNHSDKVKDPTYFGWQNSVRHNLSMNRAFIKVPHKDVRNPSRKGFIWVLSDEAIKAGGVLPTNRDRKDKGKKNGARKKPNHGKTSHKAAKPRPTVCDANCPPTSAMSLPSPMPEYTPYNFYPDCDNLIPFD